MKKSDFYEFTIKMLGIYMVISLIENLKEVIMSGIFLIQSQGDQQQINDFDLTPVFFVTLIIFLILIAFTWLLLFKTRKIASLICTKEDYAETTKLFTDKKTIVEIALIIVGLITIISAMPEFASRLKNYIYMSQYKYTTTMSDKTFILISGLKVVVGYIAIRYSKAISAYVSKEKEQKTDVDENQTNLKE